MPRAGRSPAAGPARAVGRLQRAPSGSPCRPPPAGSRISGWIPRSSSTARTTPTAPCATPSEPPAGDPAPPIQPAATRIVDLRADEAALWGDLRKKWRQYVNKARGAGIEVVDGDADRLPEFYRIYRETAARAGFLIRTEAAYRDVWNAFAPAGRARLLFAQLPDGEPVATLFLLRCGPRVVEPYGGMTAVGGDTPGQLPAQVGGDPQLARRRAPRATTCGAWRPAGSPTSRPGSVDARSATSGPGTWCSTRSDGPSSVPPSGAACGGRAGGTGSRRAATPPPTVRPIERPRRASRRAGRLGRADGRGARRPRLPVDGLGRASPRVGLVAALPRDRRRRPGPGADPPAGDGSRAAAPTSRAARSRPAARRPRRSSPRGRSR